MLAALLLDDRDLTQVERALPVGSTADFEAELALFCARADPRAGTARDRDHGVNALLRVLRPALTVAGAARLPLRARALIARLFPTPARKALSAEAANARADFAVDEELLRVLARIARTPLVPEGP